MPSMQYSSPFSLTALLTSSSSCRSREADRCRRSSVSRPAGTAFWPTPPSDGADEIVDEHDVAIDVADKVVGGDLLRPLEKPVQQGRAELVPCDIRHVLRAVLCCRLGRALVIAVQDDLAAGGSAVSSSGWRSAGSRRCGP